MNGWGIFLLLLFILLLVAAAGWIFFTRYRAHRQGLPAPPISAYNPFKKANESAYRRGSDAGGVGAWIKDKFQGIQNARQGSGYAGATRGQRGFGPLDPDAAWDDRVGTEADAYGHTGDYEEQELSFHPPAAGSYNAALPEYGHDMDRGRTRSRDDLTYIGGSQHGLDQRYDEEMDRTNPFGAGSEHSGMRGVSPRPAEDHQGGHMHHNSDGGRNERRSMFREGV